MSKKPGLKLNWKYALGEVALIFIGISLAIAFQNFNEERRNRIEEKEILQGVKKNLQNTIKEFQYLNETRVKILDVSRELFRLSSSTDLNKTELDSLIAFTFYRPTFNNTLGAVNLLFSSGKINLIKSEFVRDHLVSWPGDIADMAEEEQYALELFRGPYFQILAKYIVIQDVLDQTFSTSFFGADVTMETFDKAPVTSNYEGLFKDRQFYNHLSMRASHTQITLEETKTLIKDMNELIAVIDKELEK